MQSSLRILVASLSIAVGASHVHAQPIPIVGLIELSGAGASVGTNMKDGMELAVKEINASGGVLGRKIELTVLDTQTSASVAKGLAQRAIDMNAYAVVGPIFSGSVIVSMNETKRPRSRTSRVPPRPASRSRAIHTFSARISLRRPRCRRLPSTSRTC